MTGKIATIRTIHAWKQGLGGQFPWGAAADAARVYEVDYIFAF